MTRFPDLRRGVAALAALALVAGVAHADPADSAEAPAVDRFDAVETRRQVALAEHLHRREMLYREITVLEELALFAPTPAVATWARLRIAVAYHVGGQFPAAVAGYDDLLRRDALEGELADLARVQRSLARAEELIHEAERPRARDVIAELAPLAQRPAKVGFHASFQRARLAAVVGDAEALRGALAAARTTCAAALACRDVDGLTAALAAPRPRRRYPAVGLALSAVVPGAGSMYSAHYVDGLYYLGLTSVTALGAYDVYDGSKSLGDQKATFWGLAGLAGIFYLSNLVHAHLAAKRFNAVERHRWRDRVWNGSRMPLPLDGTPAPP